MVDQAGNPEPDEPGEIGWPADADHAHDPSVPEEGSGGAHAEDMPELSPPTFVEGAPVGESEEVVLEAGEEVVVPEPEPVVVEEPAEQPAE